MHYKTLDLSEFIPEKINVNVSDRYVDLFKNFGELYIDLSYITPKHNGSWKEYSLAIPRFVSKNERTFEVFGLLQAEMGKTNNGCLSFSNHEPKIINYVINWFEKELELKKDMWQWSVKLNIQEPSDFKYKNEVENKVLDYWLNKTHIFLYRAYPKKVTYIKNTNNIKLKFYDYGTLVLEYKRNLFSQIIKNIIKKITYEKILKYDTKLIQGYLRGIIAGEGAVELSKECKKYRVHISVSKPEEKEIYSKCLYKLGINNINYPGSNLVISKRENNVQLLKKRLMTLSPEKYAKFFNMMQQYPNISEETGYFKHKGINLWNRIPKEKVGQIIGLYNSGVTSTKEISEKLNLHILKVQRVLKENNLGERIIKTPESKRKEIAQYKILNPNLNSYEIA